MSKSEAAAKDIVAADGVQKVYACIANVSAELAHEGISKGRQNTQQNYRFRGIDDVYNALAPIIAKHGLVILPRILTRSVAERESRSGGVLFYVTVEAEFDFVCAADASLHTVRTFGEAMDSADKATNKAMSAAYKYAAFQTFCIPTEGDNDADATTPEPAPARPQAVQERTPATSAAVRPASAPAPSQPKAALAPGTTTVTACTSKPGKNSRGPFTNYKATFADGRTGSTFSTTVGEALIAAKASGEPVCPEIVPDGKFFKIEGLLPIVAPEPPAPPDDPVNGPEGVLTVRPVQTDHGPRWIIQTDKRTLVTDREAHAVACTQARTDKVGIIPAFTVVPAASGHGTVNRLTDFALAPVITDREPGSDDE